MTAKVYNRDEKGYFAKGNPGGVRRKMPEDIVKALDKYSIEATHKLGELIHDADSKVAVVACKAILDRAYGKPVQAIENVDGEKSARDMASEEIIKRINEIRNELSLH